MAINRVKQDLATKEIEQQLKHEIERQKMNETLLTTRPETETGENLLKRSNCNTLKMVTGKPFGIRKIAARIMSITTVGGHEVTRNLSEQSDQTLMHIDVYAEYLRTLTPQTPSRALRALLTRGGGKSIRIDNRYTEASGPHEDNSYTEASGPHEVNAKTIITCDVDLAGNLCWQRRSKGEIHWTLCYAGRGCHATGNGSRRICTRIGHKRKQEPTAWVVGHGSRLECSTN